MTWSPPPDLDALLDLLAQIQSGQGVKSSLQAACKTLTGALGVVHCAFVQFDRDKKKGSVLAEHPARFATAGRVIDVSDAVLRAGVGVKSLDLPALLDHADANARHVVPVISHRAIIGALIVQVEPGRVLGPDEDAYCRVVATGIAIALDKAQARAQTAGVRQANRLTKLQDGKSLVRGLTEKAIEELRARRAGYYSFDTSRDTLTLTFDSERPDFEGRTLALGEGMAGHLAQAHLVDGKQFAITNDYGVEATRSALFAAGEFESVLEVVVANESSGLMGILYVEDARQRQFFESDATLLQSLIQPTAVALQNVQQLEEQRRTKAVVDAIQALDRYDDPNLGLDEVARTLATALSARYCRIWIADARLETLTVVAAAASPSQPGPTTERFGVGNTVVLARFPEMQRMLADKEPAWWTIDDDSVSQHVASVAGRLGLERQLTGLLLMPLKVGDTCVGLLALGISSPGNGDRAPFPGQLQNLQDVTHPLALRIDRLRLHKAEHRRRELLPLLEQFGGTLQAEKGVEDQRALAVRFSLEMLKWTSGGVYVNRASLHECELDVRRRWTAQAPPPVVKHNEGLVGAAATTNERSVLATADQPELWHPAFTAEGWRVALAVPIVVDGSTDSVLLIGKQHSDRLTLDVDREMVERLATRIGTAIHTSRLLTPDQRRLGHAKLLFEAINRMYTSAAPDAILRTLATAVTHSRGLQFNRAVIFLVDADRTTLVGRDGVGQFTLKEAQAEWNRQTDAGDQKYDELLERGARTRTQVGDWANHVRIPLADAGAFRTAVDHKTALVLYRDQLRELPAVFAHALKPDAPVAVVPLQVGERVIGLLVCDKTFSERERDLKQDMDDVSAFAGAAALAYDGRQAADDSQLRLADLQWQLEARARIATQTTLRDVVDSIAGEAERVFGADFVTLWPYDPRHGWFVNDIVATRGIPVNALVVPSPDGLTHLVLKTREVFIPDIATTDVAEARGPVEQKFFADHGVGSIQAIALTGAGADETPVGVLYVSYRDRKPFKEYARQQLRAFAAFAALALSNAFTFEKLHRVNEAARALAKLVTFDDVRKVTDQVAEKLAGVEGCKAVTLYAYDEAKQDFEYPPSMHGVVDRNAVRRLPALPKDSIVRRLLADLHEPLPVPDVSEHEFFRHSKFAQREGIGSVLVLPLRAHDHRVGLLFLSWARPRPFSDNDIDSMNLFARLAAVAIWNSQLYHQMVASTAQFTRSLATVSHQLRGPIHPIQLGMESILGGAYGPIVETVKIELESLLSLVYAETRILTNMLDTVLIRERKFSLRPQNTSLIDCVKTAVDHQGINALRHRTELSPLFEEADPVMMNIDGDKVYMTVTNLLANAIRAAKAGHVKVDVRADQFEAVVTVADSGPGVPPGVTLFQEFCHGESQTDSAGIGLSVCKNYVELHGGTIEHERVKDETVFRFTLPMRPAGRAVA